ncbi:Transcriptional regulator [Sandaracinus amylolyticus]|nr:Transcriptional regulator [Sandaracinus amylolyticus]
MTLRHARGIRPRVPNERPFSAGEEGEEEAPPARATKSRGKRASDRGGPDKRERILRAAIRVFARKGFYATRVSEIAKAAGVADGTIYLYFKNKDDVLVSIFEDRISKLIKVLRSELEQGGTFDEKFRRVIELQLGLLEGQRDLAEVVTVNLRQSSRLLKQYATPLFTEYLEVIAGLVAQGQREGVVRPDLNPRILARALWGALDGVAVTWALGGGGESGQLHRAASQVASVFLEGVRRNADRA